MRKIVKSIKSLIQKGRWLVKLPFEKDYFKGDSYFPEFIDRRKSTLHIYWDQCVYIVKHGTPNSFYFLYGFDIKGLRERNQFVDYSLFMRRRNEMNYRITWTPPISVLRDKALFGIVAEAYGYNTPKNIGILKGGDVFLLDKKECVAFSEFLNFISTGAGDFFIKKINGECAEGVFHVYIKDGGLYHKGGRIDIDSITSKTERYLLQASVANQDPTISAIYPKSINTLRLVTVHNFYTDEVEVLSCVLRVGTGENDVDNWAAGGLSIGVDTEKNCLRKYGFFKPGYGTKATVHPNTNIRFEGYPIPFLQSAINKAKSFHGHLHGIHSIGWDIAITEKGPCFIEGNDNWEISLMQISNQGLQKEFDRLFY